MSASADNGACEMPLRVMHMQHLADDYSRNTAGDDPAPRDSPTGLGLRGAIWWIWRVLLIILLTAVRAALSLGSRSSAIGNLGQETLRARGLSEEEVAEADLVLAL